MGVHLPWAELYNSLFVTIGKGRLKFDRISLKTTFDIQFISTFLWPYLKIDNGRFQLFKIENSPRRTELFEIQHRLNSEFVHGRFHNSRVRFCQPAQILSSANKINHNARPKRLFFQNGGPARCQATPENMPIANYLLIPIAFILCYIPQRTGSRPTRFDREILHVTLNFLVRLKIRELSKSFILSETDN